MSTNIQKLSCCSFGRRILTHFCVVGAALLSWVFYAVFTFNDVPDVSSWLKFWTATGQFSKLQSILLWLQHANKHGLAERCNTFPERKALSGREHVYTFQHRCFSARCASSPCHRHECAPIPPEMFAANTPDGPSTLQLRGCRVRGFQKEFKILIHRITEQCFILPRMAAYQDHVHLGLHTCILKTQLKAL